MECNEIDIKNNEKHQQYYSIDKNTHDANTNGNWAGEEEISGIGGIESDGKGF